ncbi:MAG: hypothetical protein KDK40_05495, partial [Chlamydiia bacterium]|nr:hypothetical protein [Chlamydiia bacterium]
MKHKTLVPLFDGLDVYEMKISTDSDLAQKYFNQGLILLYGYNYPESSRSFRAATLNDPKSAISYWGACLSLCEDMEMMMDQYHLEAKGLYHYAQRFQARGTPKEQALIQSLEPLLASSDLSKDERRRLYIDNLERVYQAFLDDPDICALWVDATLKYSDFYTGKEAESHRKQIIDCLDRTLEKYPQHPGLNHFYIHAMEKMGRAEQALDAAKRLDNAVPGSGHLQHMPAHIYMVYGRYHDASEANYRGIEADNQLFAQGGIQDP